MRLRTSGLSFACLFTLAFAIVGCNNTLNPLCGSARPAPLIQSLSPSSMTFADVQQGALLTINGSKFVSSTEAVINSTPLSATVVSPQQLNVKLSTDIISAPGAVSVMVETPSGNSSDLGCTSGGKSSVLALTVN
ncbi:MAG TPA: IPT/TIG domain-containing protein [Candidatus Sulfotelmatobacter sp.]|nr:IPT/TIG domain-containing protein [Candidatus Sulfotelmatobacter sp.]